MPACTILEHEAPSEEEFLGDMLPRGLPFVGFWRHAPAQLPAEGDMLPRGLPFVGFAPAQLPAAGKLVPALPSSAGVPASTGKSLAVADIAATKKALPKLPRQSPYVGFHRHAPPSPVLTFLHEGPLCAGDFDLSSYSAALPGSLPEEPWAVVLSHVAELRLLPCLCRVARGFPELLRSTTTWCGRRVRIAPEVMAPLAPRLGAWLQAWRLASSLVVPSSSQLIAEVGRLAPDVTVEIAWRFSQQFKGEGVEVLRGGEAVRRVADEEVAVLGDAPLAPAPGRPPYLEVRIEEFAPEAIGDGVNDFGIGVTTCSPEEIDDLGAVADEVPGSWVVDFAKSFVYLSVDNCEEAKGFGTSASSLEQADRVGVRLSPADGALEVFINGTLRERLRPSAEKRLPRGVALHPVLDLYGRAVQLARTEAEEPVPDE